MKIEKKQKRIVSRIPRRADCHRLFTNAIPLLFDTGCLICFLSDLDRFHPH